MFRAICIALCSLILSACSADRVFLSLHSSNVINPDDQRRALSLYLKIFQLQSLQDFQDQPLNAIWGLKVNQNVLSIKTVLVQSNDTQEIAVDLDPKTKFIAVVADFRTAGKTQKILIPVQDDGFSENQISILIQGNQIEVGGSS